MRPLFKFARPYWLPFVVLVVFTYLQVMATLKLPSYMSDIVNNGIIGQNLHEIYKRGGIMLLVTLGGAAASVVVSFFASRIATGFTRDLRRALFSQVESFSIHEFGEFSTASLITRSTNDMQQIQQTVVMLLRMMLMAPIMAIGALQNALHTAPELSWVIGLAIAVIVAVITVLFWIGIPKFKLLQKMVDRLNLVTRENLTGLRVVRAFNNEKREQAKFQTANDELTQLSLFTNRLLSLMQPIMMLVMNMATLAIVWYGAHLVASSTIQIGSMMAFMQYAVQAIMSFLMISIVFIIVPRAAVSARRVGEVLATKPTILEPQNPQQFPAQATGTVEFRQVSFTYPGGDSPVLRDISFVARSGQTTALIGSTGSGKTTLINLIARFYDVSEGAVLVDGIDVRDVSLHDLHAQIGYVPQQAALFSGTVKSNIRYGRHDASQRTVEHVAAIAQAAEFVSQLEKGYDSEIAQGGANVSGGQKQRLSIARALAVKPSIYIFDDSFSALDFKTDARLREALADETKGKTVIIVGQRISTIAGADNIIVLDEGVIAGQGTHDELLRGNAVYREIAASQLSDAELAAIGALNA